MAKISEEQAREFSNIKIEKIKALANELQVRIVAKQMITPQKTIELAVFFIDEEKYDVELTPKITRISEGPTRIGNGAGGSTPKNTPTGQNLELSEHNKNDIKNTSV